MEAFVCQRRNYRLAKESSERPDGPGFHVCLSNCYSGNSVGKDRVVPADFLSDLVTERREGLLERPEENRREVPTEDLLAANCPLGCQFSVIVSLRHGL